MNDRRQRLANQVAAFMRGYRRKTKNANDPNDRHYDRKIEQAVKRMDPGELDSLLREDGADDTEA